jgi:beta-lactam-binding protein with PASTA domain
VRQQAAHAEFIEVPDFRGLQALNAWLLGHDHGLLLTGPDPDSSHPLLNGLVADQAPAPGARLHRWDTVTVWIHRGPGDGDSVREPRRPLTPLQVDAASQPVRESGD